ncbi:MAG: glycosyltransferase [Magnetococcales bacterium]|nr:glycosyltransferase [Magnetococcales bacterium]MBF0309268.1 glycosyltransferase [Magnetococcales bacterium]
MARSDLAIVIPARNEALMIDWVVTRAKHFGTVIVVNDGSIDGTPDRAAAAGAVVVHTESLKGYDKALEAGFAKAASLGCRAVITMDADGEHTPDILNNFSYLLLDQGVPLVLGRRPRKRRISERIMGLYFYLRFGVDDILCGMKGYHISLYHENGGFDHVVSIGTELALNSIRRGHLFQQVDVHGRLRSDTPRMGNRVEANLRIFRAMFRVLTSRSLIKRAS